MAASVSRPYDDDAGTGWLAFAGVMISIAGLTNVIYGLNAHGSREPRG